MKNVLILLANGFEAYEASVFTDVLGWADTFGKKKIQVVTAGLSPLIGCAFGPSVVPDVLVSELDPSLFDALAVPGGFGTAGFYEDAFAEDFLKVIRQFDELGRPIAAVCTASLSLARSGVLKGRPATTYLLEDRKLEQLASMGAHVQKVPVVRDRNIVTSSSPGTAVDVAFMLLAMLTSSRNAENIRRLMGFAEGKD